MKRIALTGFSAVLLLSAGPSHIHAQTRSPSFQYVATAGGDLRGSSTAYTAHPGSRQLIYFSNDKLTIAALVEVKDISGGVARLRVAARSFSGKVDRATSESELKSVLPREYTYVPIEKLSMPVDGGGVLALVGAIADEAGNLSKPLAQLSPETEPGRILLMSPALLRGDRVLANLRMGVATGPGLPGNPAVALYAPSEGLFIFALQPFEGASACQVILGRAECSLQGSDYTLLSARPIAALDDESKIWALHVPAYRPSKVGVSWPDSKASMRAGALHNLLTELRVEGSTPSH
jgi:hypothetical protein